MMSHIYINIHLCLVRLDGVLLTSFTQRFCYERNIELLVEFFLIATYCMFCFQSEKFRHASKVTTKLASLVSEAATGRSFKSRMSISESVVTAWEANETVSLKSMSLHAQSKQTAV